MGQVVLLAFGPISHQALQIMGLRPTQLAPEMPLRSRAPRACYTSMQSAAETFMKENDNSSSTIGREGRPLSSPVFSAAWGRVLGIVLLLSPVPSYAGVTLRSKFSPDLQKAV